MRGSLIAMGLALVAAAPASPVQSLAGRYSQHFKNGLVDGTSYWSDDVIEIVPVDARAAYVRFSFQFYNGHQCGIAGIATAEGDRLVYREPVDRVFQGYSRCTLAVWREKDRLVWSDVPTDDSPSTCTNYCGARGSFKGGDGIAWRSKRPITYLARLRSSPEYRNALTEWRTGKSVLP